MFSGALFNILVEKAKKGIVLCPGLIDENFDMNESVLDESTGQYIMVEKKSAPKYAAGAAAVVQELLRARAADHAR